MKIHYLLAYSQIKAQRIAWINQQKHYFKNKNPPMNAVFYDQVKKKWKVVDELSDSIKKIVIKKAEFIKSLS